MWNHPSCALTEEQQSGLELGEQKPGSRARVAAQKADTSFSCAEPFPHAAKVIFLTQTNAIHAALPGGKTADPPYWKTPCPYQD